MKLQHRLKLLLVIWRLATTAMAATATTSVLPAEIHEAPRCALSNDGSKPQPAQARA